MVFIPTSEDDYVIATSYLSVAEADEIINAQRDSSEWDLLEDEEDEEVKEIVLNQSSLAVDGAYSYQGLQTDECQLLKFPRDGLKTIPAGLKYAVALLALKYSKDEAFKNITSEKIGKMAWTFSPSKNENGMTDDVLSFLRPLRATTVKITYVY